MIRKCTISIFLGNYIAIHDFKNGAYWYEYHELEIWETVIAKISSFSIGSVTPLIEY